MFFIEWWNSLGLVSQVFACIALPTTLITLIQTILMFIGFGGDSGADADGDIDMPDGDSSDGIYGDGDIPDADDISGLDGLRIFSVRGIMAFFTVFGWVGVVAYNGGLSLAWTILVSTLCGLAMMFLLALLVRWVMKLRSDGTTDNKNALGVSGRVQLVIPAERSGLGKVHIMLQGVYSEREAVTDEGTPIPTGSEVTVIGLSGKTTLVVKRK